jgi:hypothetical protein
VESGGTESREHLFSEKSLSVAHSCPITGCQANVSLKGLELHKETCGYRESTCRNGCGYVGTVFALNREHHCPVESTDIEYFMKTYRQRSTDDGDQQQKLVQAKVHSFSDSFFVYFSLILFVVT